MTASFGRHLPFKLNLPTGRANRSAAGSLEASKRNYLPSAHAKSGPTPPWELVKLPEDLKAKVEESQRARAAGKWVASRPSSLALHKPSYSTPRKDEFDDLQVMGGKPSPSNKLPSISKRGRGYSSPDTPGSGKKSNSNNNNSNNNTGAPTQQLSPHGTTSTHVDVLDTTAPAPTHWQHPHTPPEDWEERFDYNNNKDSQQQQEGGHHDGSSSSSSSSSQHSAHHLASLSRGSGHSRHSRSSSNSGGGGGSGGPRRLPMISKSASSVNLYVHQSSGCGQSAGNGESRRQHRSRGQSCGTLSRSSSRASVNGGRRSKLSSSRSRRLPADFCGEPKVYANRDTINGVVARLYPSSNASSPSPSSERRVFGYHAQSDEEEEEEESDDEGLFSRGVSRLGRVATPSHPEEADIHRLRKELAALRTGGGSGSLNTGSRHRKKHLKFKLKMLLARRNAQSRTSTHRSGPSRRRARKQHSRASRPATGDSEVGQWDAAGWDKELDSAHGHSSNFAPLDASEQLTHENLGENAFLNAAQAQQSHIPTPTEAESINVGLVPQHLIDLVKRPAPLERQSSKADMQAQQYERDLARMTDEQRLNKTKKIFGATFAEEQAHLDQTVPHNTQDHLAYIFTMPN